MFRKGKKVIYPVYGPGKITDIYTEIISDQKKEYFEIDLYDSNVSISIPSDQATKFGVRLPSSEKEIKAALKNLGATVKLTKKFMFMLDTYVDEKMKSGSLKDAVDIVNLYRSIEKKKAQNDKTLTASEKNTLKKVAKFVRSEAELVLGKTAISKYDKYLEV